MSRGFLWFAQNNDNTDYVELSIKLAKSIKHYNRNKCNSVCVVTDDKSKFTSDYVDMVKVLRHDDSVDHEIKWANEYKAFQLSPFTHTIKLEADMLFTQNTEWWWYYLWQNDLVFSVDCRDYRDNIVEDKTYRQLFIKNKLPNIYNGLMYFRKSKKAQKFFETAEHIVKNWQEVKSKMLIACHDKYPSTDVVFALAYRLMDPTMQHLIDYEWFKFIHHKPAIHNLQKVGDHNKYLYANRTGDALYLGETRVSRLWHYHDKELNVRNS
jgi:hypothetical protein